MTADVGTFPRLPHLIPQGIVRELAYTGRRLTAREALEVGLVNRVFPTHEALVAGVLAIAREIAERSPLAVWGSKEMLNYARDHTIADGLDYIATWQTGMFQPGDMREAFAAKAEARRPSIPTCCRSRTSSDRQSSRRPDRVETTSAESRWQTSPHRTNGASGRSRAAASSGSRRSTRGPHRLREPEPRGGRRRSARPRSTPCIPDDQRAVAASFAQAFATGSAEQHRVPRPQPRRRAALGRVDADALHRRGRRAPRAGREPRRHRGPPDGAPAAREPRAVPADRRERVRHDRRVRQPDWRLQLRERPRARRCSDSATSELDSSSTPTSTTSIPTIGRASRRSFARVRSGDEDSVDATYRVRRADGTLVLDRRHAAQLRRGRRPAQLLVIARDVTARVEAEQRVRESERRYRELVENAPLGIFVVQDDRIVFANAAAAALHGSASPAALCGTDLLDWLNEADLRAVIDSVARSSRARHARRHVHAAPRRRRRPRAASLGRGNRDLVRGRARVPVHRVAT